MTNQTVTMPREVVEQLVEALDSLVFNVIFDGRYSDVLSAGRAALANAEPTPKRPQMGVDGFWHDRDDTL